MNLYQIDDAVTALIDPETGEITDTEAFAELNLSLSEKVQAIGCYIKNSLASAAACAAESKAFADRAAAHKAKAERLSNYLGAFLDNKGMETPLCTVSFRKGVSVEVDPSVCPIDYMVAHTDYKPDKKAIKAQLTAGAEIPGCSLVTRYSPTVK